jgi:hypothetical protein
MCQAAFLQVIEMMPLYEVEIYNVLLIKNTKELNNLKDQLYKKYICGKNIIWCKLHGNINNK